LHQEASDEVLLTVSDTGCGISEKFIETRLFNAFCQENVLAPGTGLGLSIVHNIVTMLGGTIKVSSELGVGTTFNVRLPLQRPLPGQQSTTTTPHSGGSNSSTRSDPQIAAELVRKSTKRRVVLAISNKKLKLSVEKILTGWFKLEIVEKDADVCITDDPSMRVTPTKSVILLGTLAQQRDHVSKARVEFVPTPVGPYRLARVLHATLVKTGSRPVSVRASSGPGDLAGHARQHSFNANLHEIDVGGELRHMIGAAETMSIAQNSPQALKVLYTPRDVATDSVVESGEGFPFPGQNETPVKGAPPQQNGVQDSSAKPRVLVVDDNKINLNLLKSFLSRKRKYAGVGSAENGQQAVDLFISNAEQAKPYDIVFMDISMPIMNGFEATREIRAWEKKQKTTAGSGTLIIALTGLAGSRDQAEAFDAGIDVYLTKPVSFKSVAELLDNWESNQEIARTAADGSTPTTPKHSTHPSHGQNILAAIVG
jgi:CheY-like chemotaxis protein